MCDYNLAWGLTIYTRCDTIDLKSRSQVCQNYINLSYFSDTCLLLFKQCAVATHIKKIKDSMLCVTGVYLTDTTNVIFFSILLLIVSFLSVCSSCSH